MELYQEIEFNNAKWRIYHNGGETIVTRDDQINCKFQKLTNACLKVEERNKRRFLVLRYSMNLGQNAGFILEKEEI